MMKSKSNFLESESDKQEHLNDNVLSHGAAGSSSTYHNASLDGAKAPIGTALNLTVSDLHDSEVLLHLGP
ncbi:uncharacterized [Tachysurus ichikawai]